MSWEEALLTVLSIGWCVVISGSVVYLMDRLKKGEGE